MRYSGSGVARYFGARKKRETLSLPPDAKYQHLLDKMEKRYQQAVDQISRGRPKGKMTDYFIFISEGEPVRRKKEKPINFEDEVFVAHMDFGG